MGANIGSFYYHPFDGDVTGRHAGERWRMGEKKLRSALGKAHFFLANGEFWDNGTKPERLNGSEWYEFSLYT